MSECIIDNQIPSTENQKLNIAIKGVKMEIDFYKRKLLISQETLKELQEIKKRIEADNT